MEATLTARAPGTVSSTSRFHLLVRRPPCDPSEARGLSSATLLHPCCGGQPGAGPEVAGVRCACGSRASAPRACPSHPASPGLWGGPLPDPNGSSCTLNTSSNVPSGCSEEHGKFEGSSEHPRVQERVVVAGPGAPRGPRSPRPPAPPRPRGRGPRAVARGVARPRPQERVVVAGPVHRRVHVRPRPVLRQRQCVRGLEAVDEVWPSRRTCTTSSTPWSFASRPKLKATASESTGSPLWNVIPGRMLQTKVVGSTCS